MGKAGKRASSPDAVKRCSGTPPWPLPPDAPSQPGHTNNTKSLNTVLNMPNYL